MKRLSWFISWLLLLGGVSTAFGQEDSRTFYLGFTPFPYEISFAAMDWIYDTLAADADLVAQHFDNGVPWPEALAGEPYHPNLMADWQDRKRRTPPDHQVYVSMTPLDWFRTGLAPYRGEREDMPLMVPWDSYPLNHPDVKTAFLNHAIRAVEFFEADFLNIGIEANGLLRGAPDKWDAYLELHTYVYNGLKAAYPDLPVFVSVMGMPLLDGVTEDDAAAHRRATKQIMEYSDLFALSLYPYMSGYMTARIPDNLFDELVGLATKPIAIAETGYPADTFTVTVNGISLTFASDADKQDRYITLLLEAAREYEFRFIINFVLRDYDILWDALDLPDYGSIWKDTGLYDGAGNARPALLTWRAALALPVSVPPG